MVGAPPSPPARTSWCVRPSCRTAVCSTWCGSGRRYIMMMASQIDRTGNQNISADRPPPDASQGAAPSASVAPGKTIRGGKTKATGCPITARTPFVEHVYHRGRRRVQAGAAAGDLGAPCAFTTLRRVVSNLGVFDFETPDRTMRLRSIPPRGHDRRHVIAATGFKLTIDRRGRRLRRTEDPCPNRPWFGGDGDGCALHLAARRCTAQLPDALADLGDRLRRDGLAEARQPASKGFTGTRPPSPVAPSRRTASPPRPRRTGRCPRTRSSSSGGRGRRPRPKGPRSSGPIPASAYAGNGRGWKRNPARPAAP